MKKDVVVLAVAVLMFSMAICVLNSEADGEVDTDTSNFIVDGKGYQLFADAINAAKESELQDKRVTFNTDNQLFKRDSTGLDSSGEINGYDVSGLTIDLNGKTVIVEKEGLTLKGADFTVCNGTINVTEGVSYAIFTRYYGEDGEAELSQNITIEDLTLNAGVNIWTTLSVTIKGLSFTGTNYYSVWCDEYGGAILEGGFYRTAGASVLGINDEGAFIQVKGGTFEVGETQDLSLSKTNEKYVDPKIAGGFFYKVGGDSNSELKNEIQEYLAEGYQVIDAMHDGNAGYEVVSRDIVASIIIDGETRCDSSLSDTVSSAPYGATIIVLKSVDCVGNDKGLIFRGASLTHTYVIDEAVSSTCTREGLTEGSHCSVCGDIRVAQQKVPVIDHSWNDGTVIKKATCNMEGSKLVRCTVCGLTKTEPIPTTENHVWDSGMVTEAPTCGDTGEKTFKCIKCGQTKTEPVPATGNHSWDSGTVEKVPTETGSGITVYKCTVCGLTKTATIDSKKSQVEEKDGVTTTTETQKIVEKSDGTETETETTTVSKEESGRVVEKIETMTSTVKSGNTIVVSETTVTEKAGQSIEKVMTSTSTTKEDDTKIISETKVVEKGGQKTETIVVTVKTEDEKVKTDVSVSDGTTSGIKTVITGDVNDDVIANAVKQADKAAEAISEDLLNLVRVQ